MPKNTPPRKDHNRVPRAPRSLEPAEPREAERVAKVVARAGLGSRREIEEWILAGRVAVNGEVLASPARTVTAEDAITVDGVPLPDRERTRLFLYHKPKGVVTTNYDPEGRPTLFEILPPGLPRLVSVGRLDLTTEGLILLTNDGGLSRVLELPETGWLRRYRVRAKGEITQDKLDALIGGITVDGVHYGPIEAKLDRVQGANSWLTLALREGKNREVRNVLGSLGLDVNRLIRLSYGPFQLGELPQGEVEEVKTRVLADQLGEALSAAAGADFEGPLFNHGEDEAPHKPSKARYAKAEGAEDRHRRRPIDTEPGEGRSISAGLVADRKGRKVLVQRVRSTEAEPEPEAPRGRPARGDARDDVRGGERTFRKRPERALGVDSEAGSDERVREERPARARAATSRDRKAAGPRPARPRVDGPRTEREGETAERPFRAREERRPMGRDFTRDERPRQERPRDDRPREERGERPFRSSTPRGERPERPFRERAPRPEGDRPFRERAPRVEGDRPFRERAPRPEGARPYRGEATDRPYTGRVKSEQSRHRSPRRFEEGEGRAGSDERPERGFRPRREGDERPARSGGDRPFRERAPRSEGDRPFRERAPRPEGDRPFRERAPRPEGDRPFRQERGPREDRPRSDRPFRERAPRPEGEGSFRSRDDRGPRPDRAPREDRAPRGERPFRDKPFRERSGAPERKGAERPRRPEGAGKTYGNKNFGDKRAGGGGFGRPSGDRPGGDRPSGGKPFGAKPGGRAGKPGGGKPGGGKPFGGRPGGKPSGGKPGGRPPRAPRG
ncbi:pseudouridine synthase [Starkeya koreensis]|uniref:Pseudouridine synthase n=1 Tax=Ancylobacter koreensis TaxID=266121 RepID=A0ABT0DHZ6_9HYPH|nr:pseudouridine synthase [Ancylobacter koreensis]MCK0206911.1 pseudouridine synthase [Ancylobacter koreensis]